jgi:hypothetical protein
VQFWQHGTIPNLIFCSLLEKIGADKATATLKAMIVKANKDPTSTAEILKQESLSYCQHERINEF